MIMLANQVRQIRAKKVPIQKSRQLVIFGYFPVGGYGVEFVLLAAFDYFEVVDEFIEIGSSFDSELPNIIFLSIELNNIAHSTTVLLV